MTKTERETMAEMQQEMDNLKDEVAGLKTDTMDDTSTICDLEDDLDSAFDERNELQKQLDTAKTRLDDALYDAEKLVENLEVAYKDIK